MIDTTKYDLWNPPFGPYDPDMKYTPREGAGPLAELLWSETFDRESITEGWALSRDGYKLSENHTYGVETMGPGWHLKLPAASVFLTAEDTFEFILGRAIDGSVRHLPACRLLGILPEQPDG